MYYAIDSQKKLSWQAKEVVKELDDKPHLLLRVEIRGMYFPHLAAEPFVRIVVSDRQAVTSWFADVLDDGRSLWAYFPEDLPEGGAIEIGYGARVMGRIRRRFAAKEVKRLDRKKLPRGLVVVDSAFLKAKLS